MEKRLKGEYFEKETMLFVVGIEYTLCDTSPPTL